MAIGGPMISTTRTVVTVAGTVVPDALLMRAMGWTSLAEVALVAAFALVSSAILVLSTPRHRRAEWRVGIGIGVLLIFVALAAGIVGTNWSTRAVVAVLLVTPGLFYLLLEAAGLTPTPSSPGPLA